MKFKNMPIILAMMVVFVCAPMVMAQEEQTTEPVAETEAPTEAAEAAEPETPADPDAPFETTVDLVKGEEIKLGGTVGEVEIRSIEFVQADVKKGLVGGAFAGGNEDLQTKFTVRLSCATSAEKKVKLAFKVELLDEDGNVIDRIRQDDGFKNSAKIFKFDHTILTWVLPHVTQARIKVALRD